MVYTKQPEEPWTRGPEQGMPAALFLRPMPRPSIGDETVKYIAISQPGGPEVLQIREGDPWPIVYEVPIEVKAQVNRHSAAPGLYPMPEGVTPCPARGGGRLWRRRRSAAFTPMIACALTNGGGYVEYQPPAADADPGGPAQKHAIPKPSTT